MKKLIPYLLFFGFIVCLFFTGCPGEANSTIGEHERRPASDSTDSFIVVNEYFWGTWVRMDNGKEYEVLESKVVQENNSYTITGITSSSLVVNSLGTFTKQSDIVMVCNNIPYFRKGGANLEYSLKLVGFTSDTSRAASSVMTGVKGRGKSSKYKAFESVGESDSDGKIKLKAPTVNDTQTVEITNGDSVVVVPGLKVINTGDYMGTVALVGKDDYSLKITGTISDDQKDNGYLYGNNANTYEMVLSITNISENKCSTSGCVVTTDDTNLVLESDTNLNGFTISTLAGGATKTIMLYLTYGAITDPYVDTGINVIIKNPLTNQEWTDYIPLRFFKGKIPITIAAKNPENNKNAALNGFVIYPDGNNQFFAIKNNSSSSVFVPTFGTDKSYMLVFSGATVTSTLSNSTEMYYTVEPASKTAKTVITDGELDEILGYISFGGNNHSETSAYNVTEGFEAYLSEGEIDYYTITADSDDYSETDDGFVFVEGGTVVGSDSYNQWPSGAFPKGRTVTLSSFYICDHEVTQGEYEKYCCYTETSPSINRWGKGINYPANFVSWYDAIVYCNLKSMAEGLTPCYALSGETDPKQWVGIKTSNGKYSCSYTSDSNYYKNSKSEWNSITCNMTANGYRLPTEAEWEYAARGGQETYGKPAFAYYFAGAATTDYKSDINNSLEPIAWYDNNSDKAHQIKCKAPNALGLYDMSGNVAEWCWDWYDTISRSEIVTDPCGASSGTSRVYRGGRWRDDAQWLAVARRDPEFPAATETGGIGFRLVRSAQ